jgi:translation initiation factor 2 beta subunit (eIF-2beta)/eIF-5
MNKTTDTMSKPTKRSGRWGTKFNPRLRAFQVRNPRGEVCPDTFETKEDAKAFIQQEKDRAYNVTAAWSASSSDEAGLHDDGFGGEILRKPVMSAEDRFKHKKPRPKRLTPPGLALYEAQIQDTLDPNHSACPSYHDLLQRAHKKLEEKFPNLKKKKTLRCPPPILRPYNGHKRATFVNASQICRLLNRPIAHLELFLAEELATTTFHVDETRKKLQDEFSGVLILKYRMNKAAEGNINKVLMKYITEYVRCPSCQGFNSDMVKNKQFRTSMLRCKDCHAEMYLKDIKRGFRAKTRQDKIAARIKASYMGR